MRNLTEAINRVKIEKFMQRHDLHFETLTDLVKNLDGDCPNGGVDRDSIFRERWTTIKKHIGDHIFDKYCEFKKAGDAM